MKRANFATACRERDILAQPERARAGKGGNLFNRFR
jgi:hypothetical protein